jgi:uncharacterized membrane protein
MNDVQPSPSYFEQAAAAAGPPSVDDREHAFYAHLFAAIGNLFSGGVLLPVLAAVLPMMMTESKHPFVVFHVNQSAWYQLFLFAVNLVLALVITVLAFVTCGIGALLYVLCAIPPLVGCVHPFIVAFKVRDGAWYRYPIVGERVYASPARPLLY